MYKNFSPRGLGVSGRQSEMIELALTHKFRGFDVDMEDFARRADKGGIEHAARFIESAEIFVGGFELPVIWTEGVPEYKKDLAGLDRIAGYAAHVGTRRCFAYVPAASETQPYHEHFETLRGRLNEMADVLAKHDIKIGLGFYAAPAHREGKKYQFIHQAEELLLLIKAVGADNVGLLLDTWNWHFGGGGQDQIEELPIDKIVMVRLADVREDVDPAKIEDKHRRLPGEVGVIKNLPLLKYLLGNEFDGPVAPYPHPSNFTGMTRESIVQRAADAIERLWIELGLSRPKLIPTAAPEPEPEEEVEDAEAEVEVEVEA